MVQPAPQDGGNSVSVTIPLTVTVSLGTPVAPPPARRRVLPPPPVDDDAEIAEEGVAADYHDRVGYEPDFLGKNKFFVELPAVDRDADDVLEFTLDGNTKTELRYEH